MASIPRNPYHSTTPSPTANGSGNAQLVGIVSSVPMPRTSAPTMTNGTPVIYDPNGGRLDMGGGADSYTVQPTVIPGSIADATGGGGIGFGGPVSGTPPMGAQ